MEQFFLRPPHHPQLKSLAKGKKKKSLAKEIEILPEKKFKH